ncbi:class I SAM-dependent methyltransferase [Microbacterium nymphoidis]|uniref:class I SAM-dependent methyltransferase n=1 Tax=Microbacterium nymphoidis TaxID=2898586 RepID=UPI001E64F4BE|nr:class I SAM-dependent methyltransferase [Microbacterium nymphoidis]MCD2499722.1 class I SAM-dependent methyltransferase [Microbacterium nymphoidis]
MEAVPDLVIAEVAVREVTRVDVRFDGHRVWTTTVPAARDGHVHFEWPAALRARLVGSTRVSVHDVVSGAELAAREMRFAGVDERLELVDGRGRLLAMNKWDTLGAVNDGRGDGVRQRMLVSARRVVDLLRRGGWDPFVVGGALLGVVREGRMLAHDDDIDLAFLSAHSDPSDLALESTRMERLLRGEGLTVVRHSLAHIAVHFTDDAGLPEHYIDVFTGFFRGRTYHQPFALRGEGIAAADLVPPVALDIEGTSLPAPAVPEAWLAFAYGPSWRVPDASFHFPDPPSTVLRFDGWFGSFNHGRDAWEEHYLAASGPQGEGSAEEVDAFIAALPPGACVLDVGCGDGTWARRIAAAGHTVLGVDYSLEALALAGRFDDDAVRYRFLNLNDRSAVLALGAELLAEGREWVVFGSHLLQSMTADGRHNLLMMLELMLRGNGFAHFIDDTDIAHDYDATLPRTWHMPTAWLEQEARGRRLAIRVLRRGTRPDGTGTRGTAAVRVDRTDAPLFLEET